MQTRQKIAYFLMATICLLSSVSSVRASTPTSLTLNNTTGDTVHVQIAGAANSNIQLSYLLSGASELTSIVFGATDGNGNFSTSISSGGYGIPAGSPVFASINGIQSSTILWPSYTSSLSFSQTSVQVAVGQSVTVSASSSFSLKLNSLPASISTSVNGSQITITGVSSGSGTLTLCGSSAGCGSIAVDVGVVSGQSQVAFDQNNVVMYVADAKSVSIVSGSHNGFILKSNSNTSALHTSLTRTVDAIWLYGDAPGTATLSICSADSDTNCADLKVTVLAKSATALSFSQNNIILTQGLIQTTSVSGGPDSNYYILSNSNSSVATASISGSIVTVTGGSTIASSVITVCSTSVNNTCGSLNVTLANTSNASSATALSFNQNVVSIPKGDTASVTVTGGGSSGYSVSTNSAPAIATASINGSGNVVTLYGSEVGSSIITVCSASASNVCASLYVTVTSALPSIALTQNNVSLKSGESFLVTVSGGTSSVTIYSNGNSNAVSASITSNGSMIVLKGGIASGSSAIIVCPSATYSSKCVTLNATNTISGVIQASATLSVAAGSLIKASTPAVYYLGSDGKRYVFPNEKTFKTWYVDFSSVKVISDSQLASYPIGGNVTYKPGSKMIKITTDPSVYAIDARGKLRLIMSEAVAKALYGANWTQMVDDIPDAFFSNYIIGANINSASDFNSSAVKAAAASINSDKGLSL